MKWRQTEDRLLELASETTRPPSPWLGPRGLRGVFDVTDGKCKTAMVKSKTGMHWFPVFFLLCLLPTIQGASIQETKSTFLPIFSNLWDLYPEQGTSRYVRLTCPGCFPEFSYERILTEEILVMSKGRFRGRRYVKKDEGLKTNFEIIVPMNPCIENKFKMRLRYTDDSGEIRETSEDGTYRKEACDIDPTDQLPETILLYTGINHEANNFNMHISLSLLLLVLLVSLVLVFVKTHFMTGETNKLDAHKKDTSSSVKDVEIVLMMDCVV